MSAKVDRISDFENLLNQAPTSWHTVEWYRAKLKQAGYSELPFAGPWKLKSGGAYFVARGGTLAAWLMPKKAPSSSIISAAHSDSPSFKLKPGPTYRVENMEMAGFEVYGGPLTTSWLNRDTCLAGQVLYESGKQVKRALVHLTDLKITLPQLAIHLDKEGKEQGVKLHRQDHIAAIVGLCDKEQDSIEAALKKELKTKSILSHELLLVPTDHSSKVGAKQEMLASYRLDNIGGVHAAMTGLLESKPNQDRIVVGCFWDHEEIGSRTSTGAASPFIEQLLERICLASKLNREEFLQLLQSSHCLSVDYAHARHPNYGDRHEPRYQPLLGKGPCIKYNAAQNYASDADLQATIYQIAKHKKIALQKYLNRGDIPGGSTIGPIHAARTGMATADIGCSLLSMHSIREMVSIDDHLALCDLLKELNA